MLRFVLVLALLGSAASSPAVAQAVQSYIYDANGRLVATSTTAGGVTTARSYSLDDADNRTQRSTAATSARQPAQGAVRRERDPERAERPAAASPQTSSTPASDR